ncbi:MULTISPECIES: hypothetical protein [unclassified Streptomyces]|uniref:hypothetical protein n=1 Tax=unclassified Streptomyces TaxID=2593676 RepID=UPI000F4E0636|nr:MULTISPECIES: hypothetical protein [unclassified Streptomyces]GLP66225.1 hypothetical protein TUSST3_28450 [Streptomyces sp. TUS-ST3]
MLRSVLVAAFSAVVAFGTLSGLSAAKGDAQAGDAGTVAVASTAPADESAQLFPADSIWS